MHDFPEYHREPMLLFIFPFFWEAYLVMAHARLKWRDCTVIYAAHGWHNAFLALCIVMQR